MPLLNINPLDCEFKELVTGTDDYHDAYKKLIREKEAAVVAYDGKSPQLPVRPLLVRLMKNAMDCLNLKGTTIHLAICVLDLYMDSYSIPETNGLLLTVVTALNIAVKLEEALDNQPSIALIYDSMNVNFPLNLYKESEREMLIFFDFNFNIPTGTSFIGYYMAAMVSSTDMEVTGQSFVTLFYELKHYIEIYLDKVLDNHHFLYCFKASQLAAALIFAARLSSNVLSEPWTERLTQFTDYTLEQITPLGLMISGVINECATCEQELSYPPADWLNDELSNNNC